MSFVMALAIVRCGACAQEGHMADNITHGLAAALLAQAGFRQRYGVLATVALLVGSELPDIDALFEQQAGERDRTKREALLHRIQQLTIEHVMFAPIMDLRGLIGVGPRVAEHTINSIPVHPFPALEDIKLKE